MKKKKKLFDGVNHLVLKKKNKSLNTFPNSKSFLSIDYGNTFVFVIFYPLYFTITASHPATGSTTPPHLDKVKNPSKMGILHRSF